MLGREETARVCATSSDDPTTIIRTLNEDLHCRGRGGTLAVTAGVIALARDALPAILIAVRQFAAFSTDNDPRGEHDSGSIDLRGTRLFWKVDYYDRHMRFGSPDPAAPAVTTRVFTVLLASEW